MSPSEEKSSKGFWEKGEFQPGVRQGALAGTQEVYGISQEGGGTFLRALEWLLANTFLSCSRFIPLTQKENPCPSPRPFKGSMAVKEVLTQVLLCCAVFRQPFRDWLREDDLPCRTLRVVGTAPFDLASRGTLKEACERPDCGETQVPECSGLPGQLAFLDSLGLP
ncbi:hypothetical protein AAFF_G00429830 [Aldrovandia affinis]|uniref:Uncharacterized protein n=1 Tax=Aldrovandia affinis TaxID=143900 RepID=A0AAD7S8Y9_9TELE|nr:hypothetical protein AAFF_G00429830 [Aldrovandia affinis]